MDIAQQVADDTRNKNARLLEMKDTNQRFASGLLGAAFLPQVPNPIQTPHRHVLPPPSPNHTPGCQNHQLALCIPAQHPVATQAPPVPAPIAAQATPLCCVRLLDLNDYCCSETRTQRKL